MLKYIKNNLLILLLCNHLIIVITQYQIITPTNDIIGNQRTISNLLDITRSNNNDQKLPTIVNSNGNLRINTNDLNKIYKQLIDNILIRKLNDSNANIKLSTNDKINETSNQKHNIKRINHLETNLKKIKPIYSSSTETNYGQYATNIEKITVDTRGSDSAFYTNNKSLEEKNEGRKNSVGKLFSEEDITSRKFQSIGDSLEENIENSINNTTVKSDLDKYHYNEDRYDTKYNEVDLNNNEGIVVLNKNKEMSNTNDNSSKIQNDNLPNINNNSNNIHGDSKTMNLESSFKNGSVEDTSKARIVTPNSGELISKSSIGETYSPLSDHVGESFRDSSSGEINKRMYSTTSVPKFFTRKKDLLRNIVVKRCINHYSFLCLKFDLIKIIDRLNSTNEFQILPGVHIVRTAHSNNSLELPTSLIVSLIRNSTSSTDSHLLDNILLKKLQNYLSQLSVNVRLLDTTLLDQIKNQTALSTVASSSRTFLSSWRDTLSNFIGRGKKEKYGHAAIWSAGTLAAIAFSILAAMSGKALLLSILALILAALCAFKGHHNQHGSYGGNYGYGKTSHYEIITKPAHFHDHEHLHSASIAAGSPYASYARQLLTDRLIPTLAFDETPTDNDPYSYVPHEE